MFEFLTFLKLLIHFLGLVLNLKINGSHVISPCLSPFCLSSDKFIVFLYQFCIGFSWFVYFAFMYSLSWVSIRYLEISINKMLLLLWDLGLFFLIIMLCMATQVPILPFYLAWVQKNLCGPINLSFSLIYFDLFHFVWFIKHL